MSQENVKLVRRAFAAFAGSVDEDEFERRFADANLDRFFDPEVEWVPVSQSLLASGGYQGYEGIRRFWTEFLSIWEEYAVELQEIVDAGGQVVAVMRMTGRTHGVDVDELWSSLHTLRNGRIVRVQNFASPRCAFEAAGLGE
ncbi:MAG TPA: nuclear transport factor 2 family protein [Solirubrobacterales bacterium]|jgi:ketosteroid isomerase-like protein|nr:nuclear transport factor 2 family protein [Solirubrobacterales bacterium]